MTTDARANSTDAVVDDNLDEQTAVDLSSKEGQPEPSTEPEMLTREQAQKLADEKHSKLDKRVSELERASQRATKAAEAAEARAKATEVRLAEANRRVEEAERNALGDSPDALSLFEEKVKHRQTVASFEAEKARHEAEKAQYEADIAEAKAYKIQRQADEIASEYEVDAATLLQLTDGSREKMEKLAKVLPKKEADDKKPNLQKPPKPDSGKSAGRFGKPTMAQLEAMSTEQYAEYVKERDKNKR